MLYCQLLAVKAIAGVLPSKTWLKMGDWLTPLFDLPPRKTHAKSIGSCCKPPLAQSSNVVPLWPLVYALLQVGVQFFYCQYTLSMPPSISGKPCTSSWRKRNCWQSLVVGVRRYLALKASRTHLQNLFKHSRPMDSATWRYSACP